MKKIMLIMTMFAVTVAANAQTPNIKKTDSIHVIFAYPEVKNKPEIIGWQQGDTINVMLNDAKFLKVGNIQVPVAMFKLPPVFITQEFADKIVAAIENSTAISSADAKALTNYIRQQLQNFIKPESNTKFITPEEKKQLDEARDKALKKEEPNKPKQ